MGAFGISNKTQMREKFKRNLNVTFRFVHIRPNFSVRSLKLNNANVTCRRTFTVNFVSEMQRDFAVVLSPPACTSVQDGCVSSSGYGKCFVLSMLTKFVDIRGSR